MKLPEIPAECCITLNPDWVSVLDGVRVCASFDTRTPAGRYALACYVVRILTDLGGKAWAERCNAAFKDVDCNKNDDIECWTGVYQFYGEWANEWRKYGGVE